MNTTESNLNTDKPQDAEHTPPDFSKASTYLLLASIATTEQALAGMTDPQAREGLLKLNDELVAEYNRR
jgi:hypothetical protein